MHKLSIDFSRCCDCWQCEQLLNGFRSKYNGELLVSHHNMENPDTAAAIDYVKDVCPEHAISLKKFDVTENVAKCC